MESLHIVQAGIDNGDYTRLKRAAKTGAHEKNWVVPKNSKIGDVVVLFVRSLGFVATAQVMSDPLKREDWANRYGSAIGAVELIEPPLSLAYIQSAVPDLTWAKYPRSITTPPTNVAIQVEALIRQRREQGVGELSEDMLKVANLDELRVLALNGASMLPRASEGKRQYKLRSFAIRQYALARSEGCCEYCDHDAPFQTPEGEPYLEVHHIAQLADDGPDHPKNVIALCPNCHRMAHCSAEADLVTKEMKKLVAKWEPS